MVFGRAPLHRATRTGALLVLLGAHEFVAVMIATQLAYPGYSLSTNYVSDLGNTANSPLWYVFSAGIIALGVLAFVGLLILWNSFPSGGLRIAGLLLLLIASVGAILVGFFPENVNSSVHSAASLAVFLPGGLGLVALGAVFRNGTGWEGLRWFSIGLGVITLAALVLFLFTNVGANQYPGLFERLVVAPILLWAIVLGLFVARLPVRARGRGHLIPGAA